MLFVEGASQLQQDRDTTGAIVRPRHRLGAQSRIGIIIRQTSGVIVRADHRHRARACLSYDITPLHTPVNEFLLLYLPTLLPELRDNVIARLAARIRTRRPRADGHLRDNVLKARWPSNFPALAVGADGGGGSGVEEAVGKGAAVGGGVGSMERNTGVTANPSHTTNPTKPTSNRSSSQRVLSRSAQASRLRIVFSSPTALPLQQRS